MTGHPKVDKDSKETFALHCKPLIFPYITYFYFNEDGVNQKDVPLLSINQLTPIHDFAITKQFAIFPDTVGGCTNKCHARKRHACGFLSQRKCQELGYYQDMLGVTN